MGETLYDQENLTESQLQLQHDNCDRLASQSVYLEHRYNSLSLIVYSHKMYVTKYYFDWIL